jgi:hypothetical protein
VAALTAIEPHAMLDAQRDPFDVVDRACRQLRSRWHGGIELPLLSANACIYCAALRACRRLDRVPDASARVLARCRRRWRPLAGNSRWMRPVWLFGHALYDDTFGESDRALVVLNQALACFAPYPRMVWRLMLCRWGLESFAQGSALVDRCRAELDQVERDVPDAGDLVARIRSRTGTDGSRLAKS